jgi:hypothetical protein
MMIKASGRSALMLTGLLLCFAGPSVTAAGAATATASSKPDTHATRHLKKYAHRKPGKVAAKPPAEASAEPADDANQSPPVIPPSVANANAQLTSDNPAGNAAKAMSARANDILQAAPDKPANAQPASDGPLVAADQLNDVDRALRETAPPAATMKLASSEDTAPAAPAAQVTASNNEPSSTWDQTSLIGKIFIGFGALLTMASAARMFMA